MQVRNPAILLLVVLTLLLADCGGGATTGSTLGHGTYPVPDGPGDLPPGTPPGGGGGDPPLPGLSGGVLVTIDTAGETWRWWVANPVTADYLERAWKGTYSGRFGGVLREGPGAAGHNAPWSWHVDPEDNGHDIVFFAPPSRSPSTPSECEADLPRWLLQDTLFIAYPFNVVGFADYRN